MNKYKVLGFLVIIKSASLMADPIDLKLRAAYAHFNSKWARDIYSGPALCTQLEADFTVHKYVSLFLNADYINKSGHSDDLKDHTTLDMGDLSFGFRVSSNIYKYVYPYIGIGAVGAIVHTHDYYDYVKKITNRYSTGLVVKSGVSFTFKKHLVVDIFCDYSYQPLHTYYKPAIDKETIDIGSVKLGGGLGYRF